MKLTLLDSANHRANALKTFQAFVRAAAEDTTRDAVLMETTRSIFALSASGYLGGNEAAHSDNMRIVEMMRNAPQIVRDP